MNYSMINNQKQKQLKTFRNTVYFTEDTKRMVEEKSAETHISQNALTEMCLQKYLPQMSWN